MANGNPSAMPQARRDGLVVQELAEEVLVYDTERHKAHCLNPIAAAVWRHCDGQTTVADMVPRLQRDFSTPVDGAVVWSAIAQLGKARLLAGEVRRRSDEGGLSRRELLRLLGAAAVTVPLVTTIAAPAAAQAVSCLGFTSICDPLSGPPCCIPNTCLEPGTPLGFFCLPVGGGGGPE